MNTDTNPRNGPGSGTARPTSASPHTLTAMHLNPKYFGLAFGAGRFDCPDYVMPINFSASSGRA
jgi:hypothetical protein